MPVTTVALPNSDEKLLPEPPGSYDQSTIEHLAQAESVPYDENLLERARTQWQFGDWRSLAQLERDVLQHHPDRAKLALLAAAGHMQQGDDQVARHYTRLAQDWGCSKRLVSQILIAGVHNTLGRAAAAAGQEPRALRHFQSAIATGAPTSAVGLLTRARANEQLAQLGLLSPAGVLPDGEPSPAKRDFSHPSPLREPPSAIVKLVEACFTADDLLEAIDRTVERSNFNGQESFFFFLLISDRLRTQKDKLTALHFLNSAREHLAAVSQHLCAVLARRFIDLGRSEDATDILVQCSLSRMAEGDLSDGDRKALESSYKKARTERMAMTEHGHEVLLAYLRQHLAPLTDALKGNKPVLIEIGTTRENVPGQGSTRKIAEFCKENALHFITVDMDPHNTRLAENMFREMQTTFEAVNMKGEDYLCDYSGSFDIVFLDAYDFDHGKHSKLRQSRYVKFLGAPVDDRECHRMHLDCARAVAEKLSRRGLVCIDDTWLEDGQWTAKGTLAMPYLIENGFRILDVRNRAALLDRGCEASVES
ncbi:MAG: hypothetical protein H6941_10685 [Candidatus Accumulibacter sp.]|nr:hypothetical protein [Accumulibacter sp.]